jgi:hypothetical protein
LPTGIISNYKVINPSALAKILRELFVRSGITEKSVGIVIPEFSSFSKLIILPKLQAKELNEAVLWQAQEYLPDGAENMNIDWKIVEKKDTGTEVLLVAVPKEVLAGYIESCEKAGLFPHGVQTPSVCLTNLKTGNGDTTALVVYGGFCESILMLVKGEKIIGTSVVKDPEEKEIVETATKMINHYKTEKVEKTYVCGRGMTENILLGIKKNLKTEVAILKPNVLGIDTAKAQDYIIPISLLLRNLEDPPDPKSINLMPGSLVEKYKKRKGKVQIWSLTLTITLFTWFSFLIVFGSYLVVSQQITAIKIRECFAGWFN